LDHTKPSLYGSKWRKARFEYLQSNALCVYCNRSGFVVAATVVDHIQPHKTDLKLFWRRSNWQALCKPCHDSTKQAQEHGKQGQGGDADGMPTFPNKHWL
jgi:5-methylcytosine-specific restriction enzyme A